MKLSKISENAKVHKHTVCLTSLRAAGSENLYLSQRFKMCIIPPEKIPKFYTSLLPEINGSKITQVSLTPLLAMADIV